MDIALIAGSTHVAGEAQGYLPLPLRQGLMNDTVTGPNTPTLETAWSPTAEDLVKLNGGDPIILRIVGTRHPPVLMWVGEKEDIEHVG